MTKSYKNETHSFSDYWERSENARGISYSILKYREKE